MKAKILIGIAGIVVIAAAAAVVFSNKAQAPDLPPAQSYQNRPAYQTPDNQNPTPANPPATTAIPEEINLAVPFTSQAPHKNWELPYQEFCEEASVLMAAHYMQGKNIPNPEYADAELLKIKAWEEARFGDYKDTTAEQTADILKDYYGIQEVLVNYNPNISMIKEAVAKGKLVIIPAAGQQLPNPNFRSPGPLYHMLVIKGYTKAGRIITNDPGTRLGADFLYDPDPLMNAIHDWNGGDVENGDKVVIIVG
jgi:hypothetical protein